MHTVMWPQFVVLELDAALFCIMLTQNSVDLFHTAERSRFWYKEHFKKALTDLLNVWMMWIMTPTFSSEFVFFTYNHIYLSEPRYWDLFFFLCWSHLLLICLMQMGIKLFRSLICQALLCINICNLNRNEIYTASLTVKCVNLSFFLSSGSLIHFSLWHILFY